jgi:hypothetical protein
VGRVVRGASCPWGELAVGRVVMGRVVPGASCPWSELSMGRVVHGASFPWGELSMGRVVPGVRCRGASFDGASCPWGELSWGEWSGNHFKQDQNHRRLALKRYRKTLLHIALSHNALSEHSKVTVSERYRSLYKEPLSLHKVIALSKVEPLSLLKVIALRTWHKQ